MRKAGMLWVPLIIEVFAAFDITSGSQTWRKSQNELDYVAVFPVRLNRNKRSTELFDESYSFNAFNRTFMLDLNPTDILTPNFHVVTIKEGLENSSSLATPGYHLRECLKQGTVRGDVHSSVSLSTCRGLFGLIHTCEGHYRIEPNILGEDGEPHKLYILQKRNECQSTDDSLEAEEIPFHNGSNSRRRKRSVSQEWNLEMLLVADSKMKRYHGDNLEMYILTLMASVALIFKDPSIGNNINISVVKLIVMEEGQDTGIIFASASKTLRNFCRWQYQQNDPGNPLNTHDTAILLTREDLCRQTKTCDTLGLAQSGMVCDQFSSCAVVEDNGLSAAFTIAHELGHILGIPHDDDVKCSRFQEQNQRLHIMARMLDYHSHPWSWSECSRHYVTSFLDAGYGTCLLNKSSKDKLRHFSFSSTPPGELYDMDYQCELVFGQKSKICPYMPVCKRLWCTMDDVTQGGCRTQHMPWADGTRCAPERSCRRGECVLDPTTTDPPRDGEWGEWQEYGHCSRSCGGGISRSIRECDSPRPTNGGRYCVGDRMRYRSCNTHECRAGSTDFRKEQCSSFDGKTFGFAGIHEDVKWVPHYSGIASREICKLYCRAAGTAAYFLLKEKVIDGTSCGSDTFDICVNGKCLPAGCDHKLDSNRTPDVCGVCGGDGTTCKVIHGDYSKVQYGYNHVIMVPAGASNIEILQIGHENTKDDNYLALMDSNNTYILNGDYMISMFPKTLHYAGAILEYSGSDSVIERINGTKELKKNLYVQVLTVGSLLPPSVSFNYTISLNDDVHYHWHLEKSWSPCNSVCQGEQYRKAVCISKIEERIVSDGHCHEQERPSHSARVCNTNCYLRWQARQITQCSTACGEGVILNSVKCSQHMESGVVHEIPDQFCAHLEVRPEKIQTCFGSCNTTEWIFGEWTECSLTCGGGLQFRTATCIGNQVVKLSDSVCSNISKITVQSCGMETCPQWEVGEWNECSKTCGLGKRSRQFTCKHNDLIVSNDLCNTSLIPLHEEPCFLSSCYSWEASDFSECSVSCGHGIMKRILHCKSEETIVSSHLCDAKEMPSDSKPCHILPCVALTFVNSMGKTFENVVPSYLSPAKRESYELQEGPVVPVWKAGAWSSCSQSCGEGTKRRQVACHNPLNGQLLSDEQCNHSKRPTDGEQCQVSFCGVWISGKWSECSVSCGEGLQTRHVGCMMQNGDHTEEKNCNLKVQPSREQLCKMSLCPGIIPDFFYDPTVIQNSVESAFYWRTGLWGKCSKPCGGGIRKRQVACYDETGQNSTYCDPKRRPVDYTSCNVEKCPNWEIGEWTTCSVSCGVGVQTRQVLCINHKEFVVPFVRCSSPVPERERKCKNKVCLHWSWSSWSECTSLCGRGTQRRVSHCKRGRKLERNEFCDIQLKPQPQVRSCNGLGCKFSWKKKAWSKCSATCGKGQKYREVYCINENNVTVPDSLCSHQSKPRFKRHCHQHFCPYTWKTSHWSECSKTCGAGIQRRSVTCHKVNAYQWIDPNHVLSAEKEVNTLCNTHEKPIEVRNCTVGNCNGAIWKPGPWLPCSVGCGMGRQKRKIHCFNIHGKRLANKRCHKHLRPQRRRKCYLRSCSAVSCQDLQKRANITEDGEQEIFVQGRNMKIYCYGMNTSHPKEYVTVTKGEGDNYSEIYNKRLVNPKTCPYRGARYDSCSCVSDENSGSGLTVFHRIAINISSLQVFTHDFQFSLTHSGHPVAYAESGDCYSMSSCPQGRFSVNLIGTGFVVSPLTKWISQGNFASSRIRWLEKGQVIQGKCGGYCGKCEPDPKVGLLLDVAPP